MQKNYVASGQCNTCGRYLRHVGSTAKDAEMLLRHAHGGKLHLFQGNITTRPCTEVEARKVEKENAA